MQSNLKFKFKETDKTVMARLEELTAAQKVLPSTYFYKREEQLTQQLAKLTFKKDSKKG